MSTLARGKKRGLDGRNTCFQQGAFEVTRKWVCVLCERFKKEHTLSNSMHACLLWCVRVRDGVLVTWRDAYMHVCVYEKRERVALCPLKATPLSLSLCGAPTHSTTIQNSFSTLLPLTAHAWVCTLRGVSMPLRQSSSKHFKVTHQRLANRLNCRHNMARNVLKNRKSFKRFPKVSLLARAIHSISDLESP